MIQHVDSSGVQKIVVSGFCTSRDIRQIFVLVCLSNKKVRSFVLVYAKKYVQWGSRCGIHESDNFGSAYKNGASN